jgi:hypothetical protein
MDTRSTKRITVAVVALAAAIFLAVPAPAQAAGAGVSIQNTTISGSVVKVSVRNNSLLPYTGYVAVKALVGATPIWSFVPVVLLPGQCTTASAGFSGSVGGVMTVGLNDDPNPL